MTYKEGKALKESMLNYYECLRSGATKEEYKGETLMSYEVAEMINDCIDNALETADKYRWHDLRKDPSDLPTQNGLFLTVLIPIPIRAYSFKFQRCELLYYTDLMGICTQKHWHNGKVGKVDYLNYDKEVIAWKYIEPFEEEE